VQILDEILDLAAPEVLQRARVCSYRRFEEGKDAVVREPADAVEEGEFTEVKR
jgi:hypothetical protein